jgi:hypothetical protein
MWCHQCQAEVAASASPDNERLYCTACDSELARPTGSAPHKAEPVKVAPKATPAAGSEQALRSPRELLARWAQEDALESLDVRSPVSRESSPKRNSILRFDGTHAVLPAPPAVVVERSNAVRLESAPPVVPVQPPQSALPEVIVHHAHAPNAPHYPAAPISLADKSSKWVTLAGQLFAYLGVGALTIGTVLVLMGYFGGPASYATTGWLIATAGQMLLFLGIVTLVSGGMEQTTQEVARRIDTLGERLVRIEQAAWNGRPPTPAEHVDAK